jgi:predicted nucleic acid-binding protein
MKSLTDTGFLFAVLDRKDKRHVVCSEILESEFNPFLPEVVLPELAYLVLRDLGYEIWINFLRSLAAGELPIISTDLQDIIRAAEIMENYRDSKIDYVDSVIMAIAERLDIKRILTVDRRDFSLFRPRHCDYLEIIP